ncbi:hypothetical protein DFH07DRAFT_842363 [Mycena maculata]|uniref:Uncharacterized protein n=1 Tax=Mycena maculata TaxID=230809 RepID=A0AAD7MXR1_9AGAR|nr:hypothetical protein DFH07DRAFT_842363 [Mycena maculata]
MSHTTHTACSSTSTSSLTVYLSMWRPATSQLTGTNDVPLGQRRRFGPAPTEAAAPPKLAQPSPSAYPRPQSEKRPRDRDGSPSTGEAKGKPLTTLT